MKKIYISGPMTGYKDWNFPAFHQAEEELTKCGQTPLNPARHFNGRTDLPRTEYMRKDLETILKADGVYLLPGWEKSHGAVTEVRMALEMGLELWESGYYLDHDGVRIEPGPQRITCLTRINEISAHVFGAPPTTETICQEADRIVSEDRRNSYGHPAEDFTRIGRMWGAILSKWAKETHGEAPVTPESVGLCMVALKISREVNRPKRDNRCDGAGYWKCVDMIEQLKEKK